MSRKDSKSKSEPPKRKGITTSPRLDVLYLDDHLIAVNKPAGIPVHVADGRHDTNLVEMVRNHLRKIGHAAPDTLAPANRLDREVSGVVLLGLGDNARASLAGAFADRNVEKTYWALTAGRMRAKGAINRPLDTGSGKEGKARTAYKRMAVGPRASYIRVRADTGRPHQIRKHLAGIGFPILGDLRHGKPAAAASFRRHHEIERIMLHARQVSFPHPATGETMHLVCSPGEEWDRVLTELQVER